MRCLNTCFTPQLLALAPAVCTGAAAATATSTRAPTAEFRDVPQSTRGVWAAHPAGTSHCNAPSPPFSPLSSSCIFSAAAAFASSESPPSPAAPSRTLSDSPSATAGCDDQVGCIGRHSQRGVVMASHTADAAADGGDGDNDDDSDAAAGEVGAEDGGADDFDAAVDADGDGDAGAKEDGVDGCRADGPAQVGGGSTRHAEGKGT
ncbi:unnamed protein product [Closterium sp. NIES-53]